MCPRTATYHWRRPAWTTKHDLGSKRPLSEQVRDLPRGPDAASPLLVATVCPAPPVASAHSVHGHAAAVLAASSGRTVAVAACAAQDARGHLAAAAARQLQLGRVARELQCGG